MGAAGVVKIKLASVFKIKSPCDQSNLRVFTDWDWSKNIWYHPWQGAAVQMSVLYDYIWLDDKSLSDAPMWNLYWYKDKNDPRLKI